MSGSGASLEERRPEESVEVPEYGCEHYRRNVRLVTPCCRKVYKCRVCHDDAETHTLDRKAVEQVECGGCGLRQEVEKECRGCGLQFGTAHFCQICRLYDNVDKGQFHCEDCGICRVGGREKFSHCATCQMCMPKSTTHKCIENSAKTNCPLCYEDIFSSRIESHIPPCGHMLHLTCYHDMLKQDLYCCPICGRAMLDMRTEWRNVDLEIAGCPMPRVYSNLYREVLCRDCSKKSQAKFHVIGMKCCNCGSYNTSTEGPLTKLHKDEETGAESYVALTVDELAALSRRPPIPRVRTGVVIVDENGIRSEDDEYSETDEEGTDNESGLVEEPENEDGGQEQLQDPDLD